MMMGGGVFFGSSLPPPSSFSLARRLASPRLASPRLASPLHCLTCRSTGSGTSSEHAYLTAPEYLSASNRSLSARRSTASCSSPNVFTHAVAPQDAVRTLKAIVRMASPRHIMTWRRAGSFSFSTRNSSRVSPT